MRRWLLLGALVVLAVAGLSAWFLVTARAANSQLTAARADLVAARAALGTRDVTASTTAMQSAAQHSQAAVSQTGSIIWSLAARVPVLGATPTTARAIAASLDQTVDSLLPALHALDALTPEQVVGPRGRIRTATVAAAVPPLQEAQLGIRTAYATLVASPSAADGALVIGQVEEARTQLADEIESLDDTLTSVIRAGHIIPALLGAETPQRYFVALLNPNEARGVGGFLGTWAIVRASKGRFSVEQVGSNSDLPTLKQFPSSTSAQYIARYGDEAKLVSGMNISANFPNAAANWVAAWRQKTGEKLDGALSADVIALGDLMQASGAKAALPDGGSLTGHQLTDFALSGIYEKFPEAAESPERKEYQEQVARTALDAVIAAPPTAATQTALAQAIGQRRILAWSATPGLQDQIIQTSAGGALAAPDGSRVDLVAINSSASKLDTYLERAVHYEVGQCADSRNMVRSTFTVTLTNAVPKGQDLPDYVIAQAKVGESGPINSTLAQVHLPNRAQVLSVSVNGEPAFYAPFSEEGRPSLVLDVTLPPRAAQTVSVLFREPRLPGAASSPEQPLATPQKTTITDRPC